MCMYKYAIKNLSVFYLYFANPHIFKPLFSLYLMFVGTMLIVRPAHLNMAIPLLMKGKYAGPYLKTKHFLAQN